jgi:mono/diheme cytochrome c family protein
LRCKSHRLPASAWPVCARGAAALVSLLAIGACRQDMHDQPRFIPLRESSFFGDSLSARPAPDDTVPREQIVGDEHLTTGKVYGALVDTFPFPITSDLMSRGQDQFNVFCSPCHGQTGTGSGMIVRRGYRAPPALQIDRLRRAPVGYFYDVATNGFGVMPDYKDQIAVRDRWAIVAYIRALQRSTAATIEDVPADQRLKLGVAPK